MTTTNLTNAVKFSQTAEDKVAMDADNATKLKVEYDEVYKAAEKEIEADSFPQLTKVPKDEITIEYPPRKDYSEEKFDGVPAFAEKAIHFYTQRKWCILKKRFEEYSTYPDVDSPGFVKTAALPAHVYEVDEARLRAQSIKHAGDATISSAAGHRRPTVDSIFGTPDSSINSGTTVDLKAPTLTETFNFLEYTPGKSEAYNDEVRTTGRMNLDQIYVDQLKAEHLDRELHADYSGAEPFECKKRYVHVHIEEAFFEFSSTEPFFGILALYDVSAKKRISENFYFALNTDKFDKVLPTINSRGSTANLSTTAKTAITTASPLPSRKAAIFGITYPNDDIQAVVRLERILEGDLSSLYDKYTSVKGKQPTEEHVFELCKRLGSYRQPWAWCATPLFAHGVGNTYSGEMRMGLWYKPNGDDKLSDENVCGLIVATQKGMMKKAKPIPGQLKLRIDDISTEEARGLSRSDTLAEFPQNPTSEAFTSYINDLYVYPTMLNLSKINVGRNIYVKMQVVSKSDTPNNIDANAQRVIYDKYTNNGFVTSLDSSVTYHSKATDFYEEFKVALPIHIEALPEYHLLFTFYHIACKDKKDKQTATEIGKAFLPIFDKATGLLIEGEYHLPIAQTLCTNYTDESHKDNIKWLDGRRPLFTIHVKLDSTVYSRTKSIRNFLTSAQPQSNVAEPILIQHIRELVEAKEEELAHFCPILLDALFALMCQQGTTDAVSEKAFRSISDLVNIMCTKIPSSNGLNTIKSYVKYHFALNSKYQRLPHEEIVRHWVNMAVENDPCIKSSNSWFYFEVIVKSIIQYLIQQKRFNIDGLSKELLVGTDFKRKVASIVELSSDEVLKKATTGLVQARKLNAGLAYFLRDCFRFLNTSTVFEMIKKHAMTINDDNSETIISLQFEFLTIICAYEHFVPINLPLASYALKGITKLSATLKEYTKRHFLVGLLLRQVQVALTHTNNVVRLHGIGLLKNLLMKLSADDRYQHPTCMQRICSMFWPFIFIACDHSQRLTSSNSGCDELEERTILIAFAQILKGLPKRMVLKWLKRDDSVRHDEFYRLLKHCLERFEFKGRMAVRDRITVQQNTTYALTKDTKRIFEEMYTSQGTSTISRLTGTRFATIAERKNHQSTIGTLKGSHMKLGTAQSAKSASSEAINTLTSPGNVNPTSATSNTTSPNATISGIGSLGAGSNSMAGNTKSALTDVVLMSKLEGFIGTEVTNIILELLEAIFEHAETESDNTELHHAFNLLTIMMEKHQSETAMINILLTLKCVINKFSHLVFGSQQSLACNDFCRLILKHCCAKSSQVHSFSAALLYLMMKRNYLERSGNFAKVRIQTSVALSILDIKDDRFIGKSLTYIKHLVEADPVSISTRFKQLVIDFVTLLTNLAKDSAKIDRYKYDPEMIADMHLRMANSYMGNSPDLRLANLEALAKIQTEAGHFAEAGFCILQGCKLVSECLTVTKKLDFEDFNISRVWRKCSPNVEESKEVADVSLLFEEGVCQSAEFSENGLIELLNKSCQLFKKANLYETANEVGKLLAFFYERNKSFDRCAQIYGSMKENYDEIVRTNGTGKRIAGTYYRVAFFGEELEGLDGQEYIYRERAYTSLAEVCERLTKCYSSRFGSDKFQLINDSLPIDRSTLAPNKVYIQVTSVEPYFTGLELEKRKHSAFEKSTNVDAFVFETPFTLSGKARGSVGEQWKKKTVLKAAKPFPNLQKRILIISKEEYDVSPIEVAIEALQERCNKLSAAISSSTPDAKAIQLLLQGSVRLQVNSGATEYAKVFLSEEVKRAMTYPIAKMDELERVFKEFLSLCAKALVLNRQKLIKHDQLPYQEDLEEGFEELRRSLSPYLVIPKDVMGSMGSLTNLASSTTTAATVPGATSVTNKRLTINDAVSNSNVSSNDSRATSLADISARNSDAVGIGAGAGSAVASISFGSIANMLGKG